MAKFAAGNPVHSFVVADSKEIAEEATGLPCVEIINHWDAAVGWIYDSSTNTFSEPIVEETN